MTCADSTSPGSTALVSLRCPGGASRADCAMWGSSPTFFFRLRCLSTRCSLPIRDHLAGLGFELVDLRRAGTFAAPHPAGAGRPPGQPARPGCDGRRLRGDQPVPRAIPGIQGDGRAALRARSLLAGPRAPAALAGALAALRRAARAGAGAGDRRAPGGEIVAVPDDEHVTLRPEQGARATLASTTISEATLVVDWADPSGKRRSPDSLE